MSRSVIVTGAAGAIGSACARSLLDAGLAVVGIDRSETVIDSPAYRHVSRELTPVDRGWQAEVTGALRELPPLAHVVGVAGGALPDEPPVRDEPERISVELFRASLDANLTSQFMVVSYALAQMGERPETTDDRSITLIGSFNAFTAQGMPAYSAAKAGLNGLMQGLVDPLGQRGIRVNVVAPGTIRTPRTERIWQRVPDHFQRLEQGTALRRLGSPADVADVVTALVLHMRHVTGQTIVVDGGQSVIHR